MHRDRDRDLDHEDYYARERLHDSRPRVSDYHHMEDRRPGPEIIDRRREVCKNFLLGRFKKGSTYASSSFNVVVIAVPFSVHSSRSTLFSSSASLVAPTPTLPTFPRPRRRRCAETFSAAPAHAVNVHVRSFTPPPGPVA
jgi:hypothetical protein